MQCASESVRRLQITAYPVPMVPLWYLKLSCHGLMKTCSQRSGIKHSRLTAVYVHIYDFRTPTKASGSYTSFCRYIGAHNYTDSVMPTAAGTDHVNANAWLFTARETKIQNYSNSPIVCIYTFGSPTWNLTHYTLE